MDNQERIRKLFEDCKEIIENVCSKKKTKQGKRTISRSSVLNILKELELSIENPDYNLRYIQKNLKVNQEVKNG